MPTVFVTPTSRTGAAQLYGRSAYSDDYNPYDSGSPETWPGQYQKWRTVVQSGDLRWTIHSGTGSACQKPISVDSSATWTGSATESAGVFDYSTLTSSGTWYGGLSSRIATQTLPVIFTDSYTLTTYTRSGTGQCIDLPPTDDVFDLGQSQAMEFLADKNNFFDALDGASGLVTDTLTTASTTSIDLTTPESDDPIDFEVTAVRLDMDLAGEASTDYVVRLTFSNSDGPDNIVTLTFTTDSLGEASLTFDIPQPLPGETRTFVSAVVRLPE